MNDKDSVSMGKGVNEDVNEDNSEKERQPATTTTTVTKMDAPSGAGEEKGEKEDKGGDKGETKVEDKSKPKPAAPEPVKTTAGDAKSGGTSRQIQAVGDSEKQEKATGGREREGERAQQTQQTQRRETGEATNASGPGRFAEKRGGRSDSERQPHLSYVARRDAMELADLEAKQQVQSERDLIGRKKFSEAIADITPDRVLYATGRRKTSSARVYMKIGSGKITINNRSPEDYFARKNLVVLIKQPLVKMGVDKMFDLSVRVQSGGISGQAGAVRHGIARALVEYDEEKNLASCRFNHARSAICGAQKSGIT